MSLNLDRAKRIMDKYHLDVLVATSPENNLYISGMCSPTQQYLREVLFFSVLFRNGEIMVIMPISDIDTFIYKDFEIKEARSYGEFFFSIAEDVQQLTEIERKFIETLRKVKREMTAEDVLVKVLKEKGPYTGYIGVDESGTFYKTLASIKNRIPEYKIFEASHVFKEIRMIKTEKEITLLKRAIEICEKAIDSAFSIAKEGVTETDLALNFYNTVIKEGAKPFIAIFGCGFRSAFPNAFPTDYKLKKGDIVRFDGGCIYGGYYCDIAKTAVIGQPSEKTKRYHSAVLKGTLNAVNEAKPGIEASKLYFTAVTSVRSEGIPHYKRHHCGHGIGLECYEKPIINDKDRTVLEEGMVINIETPYYEIGFGGVQVEETVLITKRGARFLSTPMNTLLIL